MLDWENGAQAFFNGWPYDYEACNEWKAGWADAEFARTERFKHQVRMTGFLATLTEEQKNRILSNVRL
jgi:hypothetical protein